MERSNVSLGDVADLRNLAGAFHRASLGKRTRYEVKRFGARLDEELSSLQADILSGDIRLGRMTSFRIRDPKPRLIHAPAFRERVLHHALMAHAGPVLDRALVFDSYACRVGKGTLAAVKRCQHHQRRYAWYGKIDIKQYFASIDHDRLKVLLARRFKNQDFLRLLGRIIDSYHSIPGRGLPIGALTSQHFANAYLTGLDRLLLERLKVRGLVRYMDDTVWWTDSKTDAIEVRQAAEDYANRELLLKIKPPAQFAASRQGLSFCGFRILPGAILLSRRRKRRYAEIRRDYENAFLEGRINVSALQAGYASAFGLTVHADAKAWRQEQLRRHPLAPELLDV